MKINKKKLASICFFILLSCITIIAITALLAPFLSFATAGLIIHIVWIITIIVGLIAMYLYW
jgi:hypothetical protein